MSTTLGRSVVAAERTKPEVRRNISLLFAVGLSSRRSGDRGADVTGNEPTSDIVSSGKSSIIGQRSGAAASISLDSSPEKLDGIELTIEVGIELPGPILSLIHI